VSNSPFNVYLLWYQPHISQNSISLHSHYSSVITTITPKQHGQTVKQLSNCLTGPSEREVIRPYSWTPSWKTLQLSPTTSSRQVSVFTDSFLWTADAWVKWQKIPIQTSRQRHREWIDKTKAQLKLSHIQNERV